MIPKNNCLNIFLSDSFFRIRKIVQLEDNVLMEKNYIVFFNSIIKNTISRNSTRALEKIIFFIYWFSKTFEEHIN